MLSDTEVDELIAADKIITANLRWHSVASKHSEAYSLEATVLAPVQNATLKLVGRKGKVNRSFALIYRGEPIKKITVHKRHTNPDGTHLDVPHKHAWSEANADRAAYVPQDISFGNINQEFVDFLKQCNIRLLGTYTSIIP